MFILLPVYSQLPNGKGQPGALPIPGPVVRDPPAWVSSADQLHPGRGSPLPRFPAPRDGPRPHSSIFLRHETHRKSRKCLHSFTPPLTLPVPAGPRGRAPPRHHNLPHKLVLWAVKGDKGTFKSGVLTAPGEKSRELGANSHTCMHHATLSPPQGPHGSRNRAENQTNISQSSRGRTKPCPVSDISGDSPQARIRPQHLSSQVLRPRAQSGSEITCPGTIASPRCFGQPRPIDINK